MRLIAALAGLALAAFVPLAGAAAAPESSTAATSAATPSIPFTKYRLANGLEVILAPDKRLPIVAVNLWYHVGAANEEPGRTGFAHLFEHMMFTGSKHIARGEAERLLEAAGGADSNASTSFDRTNYYDTVPANQLELALWIACRPDGLPARRARPEGALQPAGRRAQRAPRDDREPAVRHRRRSAVSRRCFRPGHPVSRRRHRLARGHPGGASRRRARLLQALLPPEQRDARHRGRLRSCERAAARAEIFRLTSRAGPDVPKPSVVTPPIDGERRLTVTDRVELPRLNLAWLTPPAFAPGDAELDIAATDPRRRQVEPPVQDARLRQGARARRRRRPGVERAHVDIRDPGARAPRSHAGRARGGDRRGTRAARARRADAGGGRPCAQRLRARPVPRAGARRRRRRAGEPAQLLQPVHRRSGLPREGSRALSASHAGRREACRREVSREGLARRAVRDARREEARTRRARPPVAGERTRDRGDQPRRAVAQEPAPRGRRGRASPARARDVPARQRSHRLSPRTLRGAGRQRATGGERRPLRQSRRHAGPRRFHGRARSRTARRRAMRWRSPTRSRSSAPTTAPAPRATRPSTASMRWRRSFPRRWRCSPMSSSGRRFQPTRSSARAARGKRP